ncbi:hypothetical protein ACFVHQ_02240 [Actinomycetes bacterium NPDC127524]
MFNEFEAEIMVHAKMKELEKYFKRDLQRSRESDSLSCRIKKLKHRVNCNTINDCCCA